MATGRSSTGCGTAHGIGPRPGRARRGCRGQPGVRLHRRRHVDQLQRRPHRRSSRRRTTSCGASCSPATSTRRALDELDKILGVAALGDYRDRPGPGDRRRVRGGLRPHRHRRRRIARRHHPGADRPQRRRAGGPRHRVGPGTATILLLIRPGVRRRGAARRVTGDRAGPGQWTRPARRSSSTTRRRPWPRATWWSPSAVRNGRPFVPGVPIGEVTEVIATPGALSRQATGRAVRHS